MTTTLDGSGLPSRTLLPFLDREHTIARPGYSRWMVPPAALCVHLCIGQAYAFSVFNLPMTKLIGDHPVRARRLEAHRSRLDFLASRCSSSALSAAVFGRWVEEGGPRKAMFTAGAVLGGGFLVSALGVYLHNLWLIYLGYGVLGGCGLGIGYISPVSTLIKWFPDRPGMATGMAIMGFGGGAFIASPLSVWLMSKFASATAYRRRRDLHRASGCVYLCFMMVGAAIVRVPAPGWKPAGYVAAGPAASKLITTQTTCIVYQALKTPQFWLIWCVLCLNVTAGIGVLGQASAMSQEMFPGRITAVAAAGLVGLMSLFNMGGRFFWASLSDYHRPQEHLFRLLRRSASCSMSTVPYTGAVGNVVLFVLCFLIIVSMYGGGFSTVPAYLRDMFGTRYVGAIHGLLLTAWSVAGIAGPVLVNYIREYNVTHGVPKAQAYNTTMYIMAGLLVVGFIANLCVKAVDKRHHMKPETDADHGAKPRPAAHKEVIMETSYACRNAVLTATVAFGRCIPRSRARSRR